MKRRTFLKNTLAAGTGIAAGYEPVLPFTQKENPRFRFCLNTSTVSRSPLPAEKYIDLAASSGYDSLEIWVRDLRQWISEGKSSGKLLQKLESNKISVENGIGFAPWMADGDKGFIQMKEEMQLLASVGCKRIAAPPAGVNASNALSIQIIADKYKRLLDLGRETGVMPQLEFWGVSDVLWNIGQALNIAALSGDTDARILPDIYHMFRGGSPYESLALISGKVIEVFHLNDFPGSIPRVNQKDSDRVYPGDGAAPWAEIAGFLRQMDGVKILSLELFNENYWNEKPEVIAVKGIEKMKALFKS